MKRIPKKDWPEWLKHPAVRGVYVGGCPVYSDFETKPRVMAHAHRPSKELEPGIICFRNKQILNAKYIGLHELAHIISDDGHTDKWRRCLINLGGTLEPMKYSRSYVKKLKK